VIQARRCEVAQKTTKKVSKKKTATRPKPRKTQTSVAGTVPRKSDKGKNPLYVVVIMGLVTAIALMVNRYSVRHEPDKGASKKDHIQETKRVIEKKEPADLKDTDIKVEKKTRPEKKEKTEKVVKDEKTVPVKKEGAEKPETDEVKVYFVKLNEKSEKMYLTPVTRTVPRGGLLENTMKELIKGPTQSEKKKGHLTAVPSGLKVNSIRIKNRSAEIDFNGAIEQGANGSILINRIDQIVYTATQFPSVKSVVIKINGRTRQTLGTDGLSIGGPLHRR
jgi:germination protein M